MEVSMADDGNAIEIPVGVIIDGDPGATGREIGGDLIETVRASLAGIPLELPGIGMGTLLASVDRAVQEATSRLEAGMREAVERTDAVLASAGQGLRGPVGERVRPATSPFVEATGSSRTGYTVGSRQEIDRQIQSLQGILNTGRHSGDTAVGEGSVGTRRADSTSILPAGYLSDTEKLQNEMGLFGRSAETAVPALTKIQEALARIPVLSEAIGAKLGDAGVSNPFRGKGSALELTSVTDPSNALEGSAGRAFAVQSEQFVAIINESGKVLEKFTIEGADADQTMAKLTGATASAIEGLDKVAQAADRAASPSGGGSSGGGRSTRRLAGHDAGEGGNNGIVGSFVHGFASGGGAEQTEFLGAIARYQLAYAAIYKLTDVFKQTFDQIEATDQANVLLGVSLEATGSSAGQASAQVTRYSNSLAATATNIGQAPAAGISAGATGVLAFGGEIRAGGASQQDVAIKSAQTAMTAAIVTDQDYQQAQQDVLAATLAFNLGADGQGRTLDAATQAWKNYGGSISGVLQALPAVSEVATQAGLSVEQTSNLVGLIASRTQTTGSSAGTQLARILTQLQTPAFGEIEKSVGVNQGGTQAQQLEELAQKWDTLSRSEQDADAKALTGSRGMSALLAILQDGGKALNENASAYTAAGGAQEEYYRQLATLHGQMEVIKGDFQELIRGIVQSGAIDPFLALLTGIDPLLKGLDGLITGYDKINSSLHGGVTIAAEAAVGFLVLARAYESVATSAAAAAVAQTGEAAAGAAGSTSFLGGAAAGAGRFFGRGSANAARAAQTEAAGTYGEEGASYAVGGEAGAASLGVVGPAIAAVVAGLVVYGSVNTEMKALATSTAEVTAAQKQTLNAHTAQGYQDAASALGKAAVDLQHSQPSETKSVETGLLYELAGPLTGPLGLKSQSQEGNQQDANVARLAEAKALDSGLAAALTRSQLSGQSQGNIGQYFDLNSADPAQALTQGLEGLQAAGVPAHEQLDLVGRAMGLVAQNGHEASDTLATTATTLRTLASVRDPHAPSGVANNSAANLSVAATLDKLTGRNVAGQSEAAYNSAIRGLGVSTGAILTPQQQDTVMAAVLKAVAPGLVTDPAAQNAIREAFNQRSTNPQGNIQIKNLADLQDLLAGGKSGSSTATGGLGLGAFISANEANANPLALSGPTSSVGIGNQAANLLQGVEAQARKAGLTDSSSFQTLLEETETAVETAAKNTAAMQQNLLNHLASLQTDPAKAAAGEFQAAIASAQTLANQGDATDLLTQLNTLNTAQTAALKASLAGNAKALATFNQAQAQSIATDATPAARESQLESRIGLGATPGNENSEAESKVQIDQAALAFAKAQGDQSTILQAELTLKNDQYSLVTTQVQTAQAAVAATVVPGSAISSALAEIQEARIGLASYAKGSQEYYQAQASYAQGEYDLAQAQAAFASTAYLLGHDTTDPVVVAAAALAQAREQLSKDQQRLIQLKNSGATPAQIAAQQQVVDADKVGSEQAGEAAQSAVFQQRLTDVTNAHSLLLISDQAYMNYLEAQDRSLRQQIAGMKVGSEGYRQAVDELTQIDQAIVSANQSLSGQFNLGNIRIPTVYQARDSVASSAAGAGPLGLSSITLTIVDQTDGGIKLQGVLTTALGSPTITRTPNKPRKVGRS
jgi:Phage-related minor tail protein